MNCRPLRRRSARSWRKPTSTPACSTTSFPASSTGPTSRRKVGLGKLLRRREVLQSRSASLPEVHADPAADVRRGLAGADPGPGPSRRRSASSVTVPAQAGSCYLPSTIPRLPQSPRGSTWTPPRCACRSSVPRRQPWSAASRWPAARSMGSLNSACRSGRASAKSSAWNREVDGPARRRRHVGLIGNFLPDATVSWASGSDVALAMGQGHVGASVGLGSCQPEAPSEGGSDGTYWDL